MHFLNWLQDGGPWTLVACRGRTPIESLCCDPAKAPSFLTGQAQSGRIVRVLLGDTAPDFRACSGAPSTVRTNYVAIAVGLNRVKELDDRARPSIWIMGADHAIAVWRLSLPAKPEEARAAMIAFGSEFGGEFYVCQDMIPVPFFVESPSLRLRSGEFARRSIRFNRDALVWGSKLQPARIHVVKKAEKSQGSRLKEALAEFGIQSEVTGVQTGPVITLYRVQLGKGVKVETVNRSAKDIARSMRCKTVRIDDNSEDGTIGIELPNAKREIVPLQHILDAPAFKSIPLPLALGKAIDGAPIVVDLARMPHLLIAGATGKGKSVGINAMILSLMHRYGPERCRFIMIDPKMIELSGYSDAPHMLAPVVIDSGKAVAVLGWLVDEMERRYKALLGVGARNLEAYNSKSPLRLPYIVTVVDEVADLMMAAGKEVDKALQRLAQKSRAAGIHLIVATQRPSTDVIEGVIKANFPSRIAFTASSATDSRVIIGQNGAEQLLGMGDMLYLSGGGDISRVHGAFVSDQEIEERIRQARERYGAPVYRDDIMQLLGEPEGHADVAEVERVAHAPKLKLTAKVLQYAAELQNIFTPGGQPIDGSEVKRVLAKKGMTNRDALYQAIDGLDIKLGDRVGNGRMMVPPSQWPAEFDLDAGAAP